MLVAFVNSKLTMSQYKIRELVVVTADQEKWIGKRVNKNLLKRLKDTNLDCGKELKGEPAIEHGMAGFCDLRRARNVGTNQAFGQEPEDEFLEWN